MCDLSIPGRILPMPAYTEVCDTEWQITDPLLPYTQEALQWRHNENDGVSNHQPYDRLLKGLFMCRSKKTSKLRVTGLCEGNSPITGEFPHKGPVTPKMFPFDDHHHGYIKKPTDWQWAFQPYFHTSVNETDIHSLINVCDAFCIALGKRSFVSNKCRLWHQKQVFRAEISKLHFTFHCGV